MKFQAISLLAIIAMLAAATQASDVPEHTQLQAEPKEINTKMQGLRGSSQRARMTSGTPPAFIWPENNDKDEDKEVTTLSSTSTSSNNGNSGPIFQWPDQPPSGPNTPGTPLCPARCKYYFFSITDVCNKCDSFIPV